MTEINFKSKRGEGVGALGPFKVAGVSIARLDARNEIRFQAMVSSGEDLHLAPCIIAVPYDKDILDQILKKLQIMRDTM